MINPVLLLNVDIAIVDVIIDDPVSVENLSSAKLETLMFAAISVETYNVELINPVLLLSVDIAIVDVMIDDPVSVENLSSAKLETLMFAAISVETYNVELINPLFPIIVEPYTVLIPTILFAVNVLLNVLEYTTSLLSVSYINIFPEIRLRIGAIYKAFGATPDNDDPVALITIDEAGCEITPA